MPNLPPVNTMVEDSSPSLPQNGSTVVYGNFRTFVGPSTAAENYGGRLNARGQLTYRQPVSWILGKRKDGNLTDVVRSVEVAEGDTRMVAAQANVPASYFARNVNYDSSANFWLTHFVRG